MDELTNTSATKLAAMIRARVVSPVEVMEAHLRRIEALNPRLNAVVTLAVDALERAREAEAFVMGGGEPGALHGVPVTIKDTIETKGLRTTCGSVVRASSIPEVDATAVARLKAAGAIVLGKTNVAELALTYEADNPVFGRTNNPHDARRTAGGSSGGEAAAISCGLSPAGLGSDLMGSIRVPAHFCGIVGLKPTTGRVPCDGHTPAATGALALGAVIGPLARRVEDLRLLLSVLTGDDAAESVYVESQQAPGEGVELLRGCRAAWYGFDGVSPVSDETLGAVEAAARALADAGLVVEERRPVGVERAPELWTRLFSRAALDSLRRFYAGQEHLAGEDARFLLKTFDDAGTQKTLEDFQAALGERERLRAELLRWMEDVPLIVAPVGAVAAFEHGSRKVRVGEEWLSVFRAFSYSQAFNVFGLPVVTVPAGRTRDGLPIGVQVIGRPFAEETVLAAAAIMEARLGGWLPPAGMPA